MRAALVVCLLLLAGCSRPKPYAMRYKPSMACVDAKGDTIGWSIPESVYTDREGVVHSKLLVAFVLAPGAFPIPDSLQAFMPLRLHQ